MCIENFIIFWYQYGAGTSGFFCFLYHSALYTMQRVWYIGKITLVPIDNVLRMVSTIDPNTGSGLCDTHRVLMCVWC